MGPYCNFCGKRCFIPFPAKTPAHILGAYGAATIIATCQAGRDFEKKRVGYSYDDIVQAMAGTELEKNENPFLVLVLNGGDNHDGELARRWGDALRQSKGRSLPLIHEAIEALESNMSVSLTIFWLAKQLSGED